jgi:hypothetical protein
LQFFYIPSWSFYTPNKYGTSFAEYAASIFDPRQKPILRKHMLPLKGRVCLDALKSARLISKLMLRFYRVLVRIKSVTLHPISVNTGKHLWL